MSKFLTCDKNFFLKSPAPGTGLEVPVEQVKFFSRKEMNKFLHPRRSKFMLCAINRMINSLIGDYKQKICATSGSPIEYLLGLIKSASYEPMAI